MSGSFAFIVALLFVSLVFSLSEAAPGYKREYVSSLFNAPFAIDDDYYPTDNKLINFDQRFNL